jgi:hypothetical protein
VQQFPRFTYDSLCQRAQTVDVIWFHRREAGLFPNTFFEIEHTTDFNNALIKFAEFQDFRVRFYIVARRERQGEFQKRITASAFDAIRSWVKFVDYETLVRLYEREVYAAQYAARHCSSGRDLKHFRVYSALNRCIRCGVNYGISSRISADSRTSALVSALIPLSKVTRRALKRVQIPTRCRSETCR